MLAIDEDDQGRHNRQGSYQCCWCSRGGYHAVNVTPLYRMLMSASNGRVGRICDLKKPDSNSSCGIDTNCNNDCEILVISFWEKSVGCHLYNRRMAIERNSSYEYGTK